MPVVAAVTSSEAAMKPRTNLGKRHQIWAMSGLPPDAVFSQRVVATMARMKAQMPIQTSRPTTFIKVKAKTA